MVVSTSSFLLCLFLLPRLRKTFICCVFSAELSFFLPSAGQLYTFCGQDSGRSSPTDAKPRVDWLPRTFLRSSSSSSSSREREERLHTNWGGLGGFCLRHCAISSHELNQPSFFYSLCFVFFIFHPLTPLSTFAFLFSSSIFRPFLALFSGWHCFDLSRRSRPWDLIPPLWLRTSLTFLYPPCFCFPPFHGHAFITRPGKPNDGTTPPLLNFQLQMDPFLFSRRP